MSYKDSLGDKTIQSISRNELYKIFSKLSDNDLARMYNILKQLDLSWFALSFCIEILEDRWINVYNLPKHLSRD